jgi:hypothetical protein
LIHLISPQSRKGRKFSFLFAGLSAASKKMNTLRALRASAVKDIAEIRYHICE